jgi:sulfite exporter TauE/SafE
MEPVLLPGLLAGIVALGVAGLAHCGAMCGLPCAMVLGRRTAATAVAFHAARWLSYSAVGAVLGAGIAQLGNAATVSRALQPLWTLWHVAGLAWGGWMMIHARQPAWFERLLPAPTRAQTGPQTVKLVGAGAPLPAAAGVAARPWGEAITAVSAGLAWVAWPCGLLHSALLLASLSGSAVAGATLMTVFAAISALGLMAAPYLWRRFASPGVAAAVTRAAGLLLALGCLWALAARSGFVDWCLSQV